MSVFDFVVDFLSTCLLPSGRLLIRIASWQLIYLLRSLAFYALLIAGFAQGWLCSLRCIRFRITGTSVRSFVSDETTLDAYIISVCVLYSGRCFLLSCLKHASLQACCHSFRLESSGFHIYLVSCHCGSISLANHITAL